MQPHEIKRRLRQNAHSSVTVEVRQRENARLVAGVGAFYQRHAFDFDNDCHNAGPTCRAAGGAVDLYYGVTLRFGYRY